MVTTTRATSNVPGTTGYRYYGEGEDEHFFLWAPPVARPRMPLLVYCKPGHMFNMGERVMDPHTSSSPGLGVAGDSLYTSHPSWPPTLPEFCALCRPPAQTVNHEAAFYEAIRGIEHRQRGEVGQWSNRAIYWAAQDVTPFLFVVVGMECLTVFVPV